MRVDLNIFYRNFIELVSLNLQVEFHNSINNIVIVVFECSNGLSARAFRLAHDDGDVIIRYTSLIHVLYSSRLGWQSFGVGQFSNILLISGTESTFHFVRFW